MQKAEELDGGTAWLNTAGPIRLKDLRGKFVLLDFWTYCCINCIHTLPDLAKLEKKYANQLVVIGVHSAKFDNEKDSAAIRKAILRYEISHPVVNDAEMKIWRKLRRPLLADAGADRPGRQQSRRRQRRGQLRAARSRSSPSSSPKPARRRRSTRSRSSSSWPASRRRATARCSSPARCWPTPPSKRLFIADSTHHRIVITDLNGKKIAIAGTGEPGKADGAFDKATFNDPQGMALKGDTLYVADRKNHLIRALDLKAQNGDDRGRHRRARATTVATAAPALKVGLNSPWDLLLDGDRLYIAMAGHHQIWVLDLAKKELEPVRRQRPRGHRRRDAADAGQLRPAERPDQRRQDAVRRRQRGQRRPRRAAGRQGRR